MKEHIHFLFAYNSWANERLLDACENLSQEEFLAGEASGTANASIRDTLVHMMAAQEIWLARCTGVSPTRLLDPNDFGALALIRQYWNELEQHTRGYIDAVEEDLLLANMEYKTTKGQPYSNLRWQVLAHVINHSTQHRAEAAALLTRSNHSPGDLDMIVYLRERGI